MTSATRPLRFTLPPGSDAEAPPEARGVARDGVRLLVGGPAGIEHRRFSDLTDVLEPGDLVVLNTSATLPAALDITRGDGAPGLLHVSGVLGGDRDADRHADRHADRDGDDDGDWAVEVRRTGNDGPALDVRPGEVLGLPGRTALTIGDPYPDTGDPHSRLWRATPAPFVLPVDYLPRHGHPVRYRYVRGQWPLSALQNVYADTPGSGEMPSAGRPFTLELLTRLTARGVTFAPLLLHTGVSSQESHEPPLPERYAVPANTARLVSCARAAGHRVIAVGTTVVRALETVTDDAGRTHAGAGWTDLVLGPDRTTRTVDGLITGLHPPEASHLLLLEAVVGPDAVTRAYREAVRRRYLWHEFGDSMLLTSR